MQKFFSDSLNFVDSLRVIVSEKEEEFDFSIYNDVAGVQISNTIDILEIISYYKSDPLTLINLELLVNSYRIACTKTIILKEKIVHLPSRWSKVLDMTWIYLD